MGSNIRLALQYLIQYLFIKPLVFLVFGLRAEGYKNLPDEGPYVIAANHASHFDTLALSSLFGFREIARIRPVGAEDYFADNIFLYYLTRITFNLLLIPRKNINPKADPISDLESVLDQDGILIIFPEGTRGDPEQIGHFKPGIAHLARRRPDVPILPIRLVNTGRCLPRGHVLPVPYFCEIHIGQPLKPNGDKDEILDKIRHSIEDLGT